MEIEGLARKHEGPTVELSASVTQLLQIPAFSYRHSPPTQENLYTSAKLFTKLSHKNLFTHFMHTDTPRLS